MADENVNENSPLLEGAINQVADDLHQLQQQQQQQQPMREGDNERYGSLAICSIWVIILIVCVISSQSISFLAVTYSMMSAVRCVLVAAMSFGLVCLGLGLVTIICKPGCIAVEKSDNEPHSFIEHSLSLVGITVFGLGTIILDLVHVVVASITAAHCRDDPMTYYTFIDYTLDAVYHAFHAVFAVAVTLFCWLCRNLRLRTISDEGEGVEPSRLTSIKNCLVRLGLASIVGINLGLWFSSVVEETVERMHSLDLLNETEPHYSDQQFRVTEYLGFWDGTNMTVVSGCLDRSWEQLTIVFCTSRYLFAFPIEFALLVGEFLIGLFFYKRPKDIPVAAVPVPPLQGWNHDEPGRYARRRIRRASAPDCVSAHALAPAPADAPAPAPAPAPARRETMEGGVNDENAGQVDDGKHVQIIAGWNARQNAERSILATMFTLGVGVNFIYLIFGILTVLVARKSVDLFKYYLRVYEICAICYWSIVIVLIGCAFVLVSLAGNQFKNVYKKFNGIDYLTLFAGAGAVIYELVCLTAVIVSFNRSPTESENWKDGDDRFFIASEVLNLVQFVLQVPFVFYADRVHFAADRPHTTAGNRTSIWQMIFRAILFLLAVSNFTMWVQDSVAWTQIIVKATLLKSFFSNSIAWFFLDGIFLPFGVFFRFSSFLLFLRAFLCLGGRSRNSIVTVLIMIAPSLILFIIIFFLIIFGCE